MKEAEEKAAGYALPKSVMRWVAVGVTLSTAVVVAIVFFSGVTWSDLERLGYLPFGLAAAASLARLVVQTLRFRVITVGLAGDPRPDLRGAAVARMSSEFIAMSTPSEVGGPVLRAAWLSARGVEGGKSLWIGYFEVLIEIYVGSALGLVAAAYALSKGAVVLGSTIAVIATLLIVGYTLVFIVPALRSFKVPHQVFSLASLLLGARRATALYLHAVVGSLNFSLAARAIMSRQTLPVVVKAVGLTVLEDFLEGTALWLVLNAAGLKIDIFSATIAAFGVLTIAALPVSDRRLWNHGGQHAALPLIRLRILLVGGYRPVENRLFSGRLGGVRQSRFCCLCEVYEPQKLQLRRSPWRKAKLCLLSHAPGDDGVRLVSLPTEPDALQLLSYPSAGHDTDGKPRRDDYIGP